MSSHTHDTHAEHGHDDHGSLSKGKIWQVFFILLGITVIEFFVALYMVPNKVWGMTYAVANPIYIILTLAKAYFIVAFFMHLKFEKVALIYSMVVPILFIIGLILVLTNESHYWVTVR